ncbi:MAG: hypothetical protein HYV14_08310 [Elusimicrobia bacterium]|nr:hypothetical protein [Elusimicrobiota bacterium]
MPRPIAAALLLLAACSACSPRLSEWRRAREETAERGSSQGSTLTNELMVEKYGPPTRMVEDRLVWEDRGPWKRIVVWDELGFFDNSAFGRNIESSIVYPVPADKRDALAAFSSGLRVSADGNELSARSTSEERNVLMLNLADGIVKGRLTVEEARGDYLRTLQLAAAGKSQPSMRRLLFR